MLFASNFILNNCSQRECWPIHPFIDQSCNNVGASDASHEILVPDVVPAELLRSAGESPDFSMCAGEFLEVYRGQSSCWDAIVTCFFIVSMEKSCPSSSGAISLVCFLFSVYCWCRLFVTLLM